MSVNQREAIMTLYLKKYKAVIEGQIGFELSNIELERSSGGKRIDLYAVNKHRRLEVFVEVQVTASDRIHLERHLNEIILSQSEGIVVWVAAEFNKGILPLLEQLDALYKLDIWNNLDLINQVEQPLKLVEKFEQIPKMHVGKTRTSEQYDLTRLDDVKLYVLDQLRERISFFPNVHKAKKHLESNRRIIFGGGRDGINYCCSVNDVRNRAFVALHFSSNCKQLYNQFLTECDSIREQVHPDIVFQDRTIGLYFKPLSELDLTIARTAEILKKMIFYFTPTTYHKKAKEYTMS